MKFRKIYLFSAILLLAATAKGEVQISKKMSYRIQALTNVFENSTLEFQYGYIENIHDGRGYTAGRVGFTTATGDLVEFVERYTKVSQDNDLRKFLPELHRLAVTQSDSTKNLRGFKSAWVKASHDFLFRKTQDECVDEFYFQPAIKKAQALGLQSALSLALVYDTLVQHGDGEDEDGFDALVKKTNLMMGGTPAQGVNEKKWFNEFVRVREKDLLNPFDVASATQWRESVGRVYCFIELANNDHWTLKGKIHVNVFGFDGDLP